MGGIRIFLAALMAASVFTAPARAEEPEGALAAEAAPADAGETGDGGKAGADTSPSLLGGFATDPDAPIEIEADTLEVEQNKQTATFFGNVVATQAGMILRSDQLKVAYDQSKGTGKEAGGSTEITRIDATGNVHVTSTNDQSADGEWATYDVTTHSITMGDRVVLRQGANVIRGTKLFIDLNSGHARVAGGTASETGETGGNGRVKGLFQPPSKQNP